jgi:hypothetical protein
MDLISVEPSARDHLIERLTVLQRRKRELTRESLKLQTKVANLVRKSRIEISPGGAARPLVAPEEVREEYDRLMEELQRTSEARREEEVRAQERGGEAQCLRIGGHEDNFVSALHTTCVIYKNDRLATTTQEIKEKSQKIHNSYL